MAVILYATLDADPTPNVDLALFPHFDKVIHAIMFGGLAGAIGFDRQRANRARPLSATRMAAICALCVCIGALDEAAQGLLTEGRTAEWLDLAADSVGIAVAFVSAPYAIRRVLHIT